LKGEKATQHRLAPKKVQWRFKSNGAGGRGEIFWLAQV